MPAMDPTLLDRAERSLRRRDPVLRDVIRRVGPPRIRHHGGAYRALLRSVLFQQLAGSAARTIEQRFVATFGGRYPPPVVLLAASDAALRAAGLSRQKVAAMRAVATAFSDGTVRPARLPRMEDEEVVEAVTRIRGIGEWTAHMLLMFSLGRPDVLPVGDFGIRKGVQRLYDLRDMPDAATLERIARPWRPYRSVASWYVWRALDPEAGGA
jgi:DNA-3-methyladenine glycosylase II